MPIRLILSFLVAVLVIWTWNCRAGTAQEVETIDAESEAPRDPDRAEPIAVPQKVEVAPTAGDNQIATRLQKIFVATGWFSRPSVRVDEGVVFITGTAKDEEAKDWASNLARRTEGVVAVVNQLQLAQPSLMNLDPAWQGLNSLWRDSIAFLPFIAFGFFILIIFSIAARLAAWAVRASLLTRLSSPLLRDVIARVIGILVFLLGIYIVLRVSGLTRLALTVVGGTGILGLVIGIAFRDITENFLASIFLSMRRPFLVGDLVEIVGVLGYVQSLTTRSTVLMTLNGNRVEIPNSVVYKNTIRNFSTNKNRREDFTIGIGFNVRIADAQEVALRVLRDHPAVLKEPEPWALVESLGASVVTLRIYFWLDGSTHSWLKVRSSVIRLTKRAFQDASINMPDNEREIVFPQGVPVQLIRDAAPSGELRPQPAAARGAAAAESAASVAEGGLGSEATEVEDQARHSRRIEGENLLDSDNKLA